MVEYFVYGRGRPGTEALLEQLTQAHWSFMDRYAALMIARGPTLTPRPHLDRQPAPGGPPRCPGSAGVRLPGALLPGRGGTLRCWCAAGATCWAAPCGSSPPSSAMPGGCWSSATASRAWTGGARRWRRRSGAGSTSPATAAGSSWVGPCWPATVRGGWAACCWCSWVTVPRWRPCWPARRMCRAGGPRAWRSTTGSSADAPKLTDQRPRKAALPGPCSTNEAMPSAASSVANSVWKAWRSSSRPASMPTSRPLSMACLAARRARVGPLA